MGKTILNLLNKMISIQDVQSKLQGNVVKQICYTLRAYAALMQDGSVVTWGRPEYGGDNSTVQSALKQGVDTIYSTSGAFAAKMRDGSVVTWGSPARGGDCSAAQAELNKGVDTIYSGWYAFAAKMRDGSVVT
jgi:hypothetical protein